jgi:hypothetical protein
MRRLIIGLVLGLIVGGVLAAALVRLGLPEFVGAGGDVLAYASAAVAGVLTGLVAGKPIWASGAKIEAALKAVFGALMGAGGMFALRQWVKVEVPDIALLGIAGPGTVGAFPATSLPIIAAVLGALFGLDNTNDPTEEVPKTRKRVAAAPAGGAAKARIGDAEEAEDAPVAGKRAKR